MYNIHIATEVIPQLPKQPDIIAYQKTMKSPFLG